MALIRSGIKMIKPAKSAKQKTRPSLRQMEKIVATVALMNTGNNFLVHAKLALR